MNLKKTSIAALLLLPLPLVGFISRGDAVAFEPAEGTSVSKSLTLEATFYLDDMSMVVDGQEMPGDMFGGGMDQAMLVSVAMGVTDEYVKSGSNRMQSLLRTYDDLSLEVGVESDSQDVEKFGDLEGSTVSFKWDDESDEYTKSFHESEGDEAILEALEADMDFLALLPEGEVSEGDTWEVKGEGLHSIFFPGGMPVDPSGGETAADAQEMAELFKEELEGQLKEAFGEFTVECTYKGASNRGDTRLGTIAFKFEGEADIDLTEVVMAAIELQGGEMGIEADLTATLGLEFDGEGTLIWGLADGHVSNFAMESELIVNVAVDGEVDAMGESHSFDLSAEVSGEATWSMETDAE
ncbi:MAG: hypothetical protein ACI9F9_001026 [Candidatus Paceibacteria bacterium]|jgi:hypothetical protein